MYITTSIEVELVFEDEEGNEKYPRFFVEVDGEVKKLGYRYEVDGTIGWVKPSVDGEPCTRGRIRAGDLSDRNQYRVGEAVFHGLIAEYDRLTTPDWDALYDLQEDKRRMD